ncbi:MAG: putative HAD-superfamily hydrolase, subfamily variant 3 [Alphaproteobacteria bacterium]|nr:putative HAD-superfamily hydrolase, subfamily variant 3 [Alphaproteobacteria bacterium]
MSGGGETEAAGCLLFDYGGTLDSDGIAWKERFHALYRAEGLDIPAEAFDRIFYDADDPLVGTLDVEADLEETVRRLVANLERGAAPWLGEDAKRGPRVVERFLEATQAVLRRNIPVLEALASRYRLGIVSNFYGNLEAVCRGLGLDALFGAMADSERVGAGKPDPAIFRAAMEPLGAWPETTIMIGDSLRRDGEGARRSGLGFIWIAPAEAHAQAAGNHPAVASLDGLAGVLP